MFSYRPPIHEYASVGRPARTYQQQPSVDTRFSLKDLPGVTDNRDRLRNPRKSMLAAWLDDEFYCLEYSDYWPHLYCDTHNVSADMFFSLLQEFYVAIGSPHRIFNCPARTHSAVDKAFGCTVLLTEILWRLQVQSQQQVQIIRNTYNNLKLVHGHG